jgi:hypothetical protein
MVITSTLILQKVGVMKLNRLGAFTLGVVITAVSVGAVSIATASGGSTITACANKSTGAMRLLAKGSCKKTEKKVAWNQQGIQGPAPDVNIYAKKTEVLSKTITTQPIPVSPLPSGNTILIPGATPAVTDANELVGMSSRSYTRRYEITTSWRGEISGRCPADAPVPLSYGVYALDSAGQKFGEDGWPPYGWYTLGSKARIMFEDDAAPPATMTLYVTQVCGPITRAISE